MKRDGLLNVLMLCCVTYHQEVRMLFNQYLPHTLHPLPFLSFFTSDTSVTLQTTFPYFFITSSLLQVTLSANILEPFSAEFIQHRTVSRTDDLALSFALAMMDFVEWDLLREAARRVNSTQSSSSSSSSSFSSVTVSSTLQYLKEAMKWYDYPHFIIQMLLHPPTWAAWR